MKKFNTALFASVGSGLFFVAFIGSSVGVLLVSGGELALEWEAFSGFSQKIIILFVFDYISVIFLATVSLISSCVFFYSVSYMGGDMHNPRFGALVVAFILSMWLMILSPNLISLLLGWDGLGVTSYLLVCYYMSEKSFNASMLTALSNRVGDVALLLCISMWASHGMFNYGVLSSSSAFNMSSMMGLVVLAAMTKSAQIPFSAWLPAAMAAPTPVSALVHSSTLVTAGVYLLVRMNYLIVLSGWGYVLLGLGLLTMTMAGAAAIFELDMKKVIALSTLSQLGVMFFSLGLGQPFMAFFHLISHAYFKAMLFMAAGAIIHSVKDYQDLRKMGGGAYSLMSLGVVCLVSNLSLCGMPFMSGFYSKDLILESMMMGGPSLFVFSVGMLATGLTVVYSCRLTLGIFSIFSGREAFSSEADGDSFMMFGMSVLMIPAISGGWWLSGLMSSAPLIYMGWGMKMFILVLILSCGIGVLKGIGSGLTPKSLSAQFTHQMWFMPYMFSLSLTKQGLNKSKNQSLSVDESWLKHLSWAWATSLSSGAYYSLSSLRATTLMSLVLVVVMLLII